MTVSLPQVVRYASRLDTERLREEASILGPRLDVWPDPAPVSRDQQLRWEKLFGIPMIAILGCFCGADFVADRWIPAHGVDFFPGRQMLVTDLVVGLGLWWSARRPLRGAATVVFALVMSSLVSSLRLSGVAVVFAPLALPVWAALVTMPWWGRTLSGARPRRRLMDAHPRRRWPFAMAAIIVLALFALPLTVAYRSSGAGSLRCLAVYLPLLVFLPALVLVIPRVTAALAAISVLLIVATGELGAAIGLQPRYPLVALLAVMAAGALALGRSRRATAALWFTGLVMVAYTQFDHTKMVWSQYRSLDPLADPAAGLMLLMTWAAMVYGGVALHRHLETTQTVEARTKEVAVREVELSERARLARDLHDVVAHHVSLIAVRAETAPYTHPSLDAQGRELLADIAQDARRTLEELRGALGILRRTDVDGSRAETAPLPGGNDLTPLVERNQAAGMAITLADQRGAYAELVQASGRGYVMYRVLQEALTNARRHAPGQPVMVLLADTAPQLVVSNPVSGPGSDQGFGAGLIGMRERVESLGGQLVVTDEDDFRVEVHWNV